MIDMHVGLGFATSGDCRAYRLPSYVWKMTQLESNDAGFVSDGEDRLATGIVDSVRADIQKEVDVQYAE